MFRGCLLVIGVIGSGSRGCAEDLVLGYFHSVPPGRLVPAHMPSARQSWSL